VTAESRTSRRAVRAWLRPVLSLAIAGGFIAFVEWYAGWLDLLAPWRALSPFALVAATGLMILTHAARAMRVHDYFGAVVAGRRLDCLRLVLQHNLFNNLLPMRSGELAFPVLMARRFGIRAGESVPGLLWFRLLDLHTLVLLATPVLAPFLPMALLLPAMAAWLLLPWLGWRGSHRLLGAVEARGGRPGALATRVRAGLPRTDRVFWKSQTWTLVTWSLKLAVFVWLLLQFAPLSVLHALPGAIGGELTSVLPIHGAGGFGTYEAGIVAGSLASGLDGAVLLRAAVNLHLFVLGVTLLTGALAFLPGRAGAQATEDGESS